MKKLIAFAFFSLPLSVSAGRAAIIDPAPSITNLAAGGSIQAETVVEHPYSREGSVGTEDFTGAGRTSRMTSSSASVAIIDLSRAPSVSSMSQAGVHTAGPDIGQSTAALFYYFKIVGPTTTDIPVLVQAEGQTKISGPSARATASFILIGSGSYVINDSMDNQEGDISAGVDFTPKIQSFNVNQYYNLKSNNEYLVELQAYSGAADGNQLPGPSLASAFVDPLFSIDPSFSGYSLDFSAGINNSLVSAVPLPATLPMFGAALMALGAARYGMKRKKG